MAESKAPKTRKVVMMVVISGTRDGEEWPPIGESITVPIAEGENLIAQKKAVSPSTWANARKKRG